MSPSPLLDNVSYASSDGSAFSFRRFFAVLLRFYSLSFWLIFVAFGAHGMILKGPLPLFSLRDQLLLHDYVLLFLSVVVLGMGEAYYGFHKAFAPLLVRRSWQLSQTKGAGFLDFLLSPLTASALLGCEWKKLVRSWGLLLGILLTIEVLKTTLERYPVAHAIIDSGVSVGLLGGEVAILICVRRFCREGLQLRESLEGLVASGEELRMNECVEDAAPKLIENFMCRGHFLSTEIVPWKEM